MRGRRLKLDCPEVAAIIDKRHGSEKPGWLKDRMLAIKLAARGEYTAREIGEFCGISRSKVFELLKAVRSKGLESICERDPGGRPEGWRKGIGAEVMKEFYAKLGAHEFNTLEEARRWLRETHGLEVHYNRIWYWAKKLGGVLRVPRPRHSKNDPAAAEEFRKELSSQLEALGLERGTRARVWVMDEARFGLHTLMRKVWCLRGCRPVIARQTRYEWDYLYGSMDVVEGEAHFCQVPNVSLEWDQWYLEDLAATDPEAIHVVIRDQAGFHLRNGNERLPANVRIINLPPYSPELNPCEQLWDLIKDAVGNRVYKTIEELRGALTPVLRSWWTDPGRVISLIGRPWLRDQANAS